MVDLTQEMSSQLQSGFIHIQVVAHLLLLVLYLVWPRFQQKVANEIHFVIACLCQKGGGTLAIFMYFWINSRIFMHYGLTLGQYSCANILALSGILSTLTLHCGTV